MKKSKYIIPGFILFFKNKNEIHLLNQFTNAELAFEPQYYDSIKYLYNNGTDGIYDEVSQFLFDNEFLLETNKAQNVLNSYYEDNERKLIITILPTEKCNFRCIYCYENHEISKEKTINYPLIIEFIKKQVLLKDFNEVYISWFGGEPLLKMKEIQSFMNSILKIVNGHNLSLNSAITSNGYLITESIFQRLIDEHITNFQITVDGDNHDKNRVLPNGEPTMNVILNNIKMMHETSYDFNVIIRVNIDNTSGDNSDFYRQLKNVIQNDPRFSISIHNFFFDEAIQTTELNYCDSEELKHLNEATAKKYNLNTFSYDKISPISICYACCQNAYVFRPNGKIIKCTVSLDSEWNQIGKIDKDIHIDTQKNIAITNHSINENCIYCNNIIHCQHIRCLKEHFISKNCDYVRSSI